MSKFDEESMMDRLKRRWATAEGGWNWPGRAMAKSFAKQYGFHKTRNGTQNKKASKKVTNND